MLNLLNAWWEDEMEPRIPFSPTGGPTYTYDEVNVNRVLVVEGTGDFPVEMLRHDRAFCFTPIPHPSHPWSHKYRVLVGWENGISVSSRVWKSFGWTTGAWAILPSWHVRRLCSWKRLCHRCGTGCEAFALSVFNRDLLCRNCESAERNHHDFRVAVSTLRYYFNQSNYSFDGIGWSGLHNRVH